MEDLVKLGSVYGMTPNDIARLAGWWAPGDTLRWDPGLEDVQRQLDQLPQPTRQDFVGFVRHAFLWFRDKERYRGKGLREAVEMMSTKPPIRSRPATRH